MAVEGPLGKLKQSFLPLVNVKFDEAGKRLVITRNDETSQAKAVHGLTRALVRNMVEGVTKGYEKKLEIVGVGYLAAIQKNQFAVSSRFCQRSAFADSDRLECHGCPIRRTL